MQAAFADWTNRWKESRLLERFAQLPDDVLNVRIWQVAARISKTFGSVAEAIEAASEGSTPLEDCLDTIADAFSESEAEFKACEHDLEILSSFVKGAELRSEIRSYLAVCEITQDPNIEQLRERTVGLVDAAYAEPSDAINREMGDVWEKFKQEFAEYFDTHHTAVMKAPDLKAQLNETLKSDQWWEFDMLSTTSIFDPGILKAANEYRRRIIELDCGVDTKEILSRQPFCLCTFSLNKSVDCEHLPKVLNDTIGEGLKFFRKTLLKNSEDLVRSLEFFSDETADRDLSDASNQLVAALTKGDGIPPFTDLQLKILREIFKDQAADTKYGSSGSKASGSANVKPKLGFQTIAKELTGEFDDDSVTLNI